MKLDNKCSKRCTTIFRSAYFALELAGFYI